MLVEVEKEAAEVVYLFLADEYPNTLKTPSKAEIEKYVLGRNDAIIVKNLLSSAPMEKIEGLTVPSLEKILVDLVSDEDLFFFIQGQELRQIYQKAFSGFTINLSKLMRYARRRNKSLILEEILKSDQLQNLIAGV